jgi:hypothetical protein
VRHQPLSQVSNIQRLLSQMLIRQGGRPFDPVLDDADQSMLGSPLAAGDMILDLYRELCIGEYGELHPEDSGLVGSDLSRRPITQPLQLTASRGYRFAESAEFDVHLRRGDACP